MLESVVDASIALSAVLPDEMNRRANKAWELVVTQGALVPSHWALEVANGLLVAQRRRRITDIDRRETISDLMSISVVIDGRTIEMAWSDASALAVRHQLTVYDAAYLELALRAGLPLATLDEQLFLAARKEKANLVV